MEVYSFPTGPIMVNTYLAFDETRKAFIVDPGGARTWQIGRASCRERV